MSAIAVLDDDLPVENTERKMLDILKNQVEIANALQVFDESSFRKMTALYAESKNWEKRIEFLRKEANAPDQERINARNDKAKEMLTPIRQIQAIAKQKADGYQRFLEEQKRIEEEKIQAAVAIIGLEEVPFLDPVDKSIRGDGAIAYTRTVRKFRIVDLSHVPLKYLQLNEDAVKQDLKLGIGQIPGIEIFDDQITQLKTR